MSLDATRKKNPSIFDIKPVAINRMVWHEAFVWRSITCQSTRSKFDCSCLADLERHNPSVVKMGDVLLALTTPDHRRLKISYYFSLHLRETGLRTSYFSVLGDTFLFLFLTILSVRKLLGIPQSMKAANKDILEKQWTTARSLIVFTLGISIDGSHFWYFRAFCLRKWPLLNHLT